MQRRTDVTKQLIVGTIHHHPPVLFILAAFSRHPAALQWTVENAGHAWGPIALASEEFEFTETNYYERTMGTELFKQFLAFERLIDPAVIVQRKQQTNQWEQTYSQIGESLERRPLNLDPGYMSDAKLVLASTKDHAHRIYLSEGIFAEVTLHYSVRRWQPREWTYPDYQRADYHAFFDRCREYYRRRRTGGL